MQTRQPAVRVNKANLKFAYDMRGFTSYEQLAKAAGVSKGTIGNLMTKRSTCSAKTARAIAKALDVKADQIFLFELCTVTRAECSSRAA